MAYDASFFVFSFGFPREFTIQKGNGVPGKKKNPLNQQDIIWQKALASGSLLKVSARDNRDYYHALHKAKGAGERWSLIFRVIKTFILIDPVVAEEVNNSMYRFVSKAQVKAGRLQPTSDELDAFARSQTSFTTCTQRRETQENEARREQPPSEDEESFEDDKQQRAEERAAHDVEDDGIDLNADRSTVEELERDVVDQQPSLDADPVDVGVVAEQLQQALAADPVDDRLRAPPSVQTQTENRYIR
jgi:hypothetical protein